MKIEANKQFTLSGKKGFKSLLPVNIVKDGKPFYSWAEGNDFNLPKGTFTSDVEIEEIKPLTYSMPAKRKRERFNIKPPKKINVVFGDNPNKASIHLEKGLVLLDNKFKDSPEVLIKYIVLHEKGHYYYTTEEFCDEYAGEKLLEEGYNKSQVLWASKQSLGEQNIRHFQCTQKIKNSKRHG